MLYYGMDQRNDAADKKPHRQKIERDKALCIVVLGGSGDLALRRILPALYRLWSTETIPKHTTIVGLALQDYTDGEYKAVVRDSARTALPVEDFSDASFGDFCENLHYIQGNVAEDAPYETLASRFLAKPGTNALFYFACTPDCFGIAAKKLASHSMGGTAFSERASEGHPGFRRLVIEKPFGTDLAGARALNALLHRHYREEDIFRIDHYLGKDAVQNLIYFRFANTIFEPLWNRKYIDRVEISLSECDGMGSRGAYYDKAGASRDMLQSHLMQLFCMSAMETPESLSPEDVREEKVKLLKSVRPVMDSQDGKAWVRGQYRANPEASEAPASGRPTVSYRDEPLVNKNSLTETFVALRLHVDNWRWQGVPFILSTGKALSRRRGEIVVHFRQCPIEMPGASPDANKLVLRIQPDEGVSLRFNTKAPGSPGGGSSTGFGAGNEHEELVGMLRDSSTIAPGPYERLLEDALRGDSTLFIRFDETEEAWRIIDPMLEQWAREDPSALVEYAAGGGGPDLSALYRAPSMRPRMAAGA